MAAQSDIDLPMQQFSQRYRLIRKIKDPFGRDFNIVKDMRTQRRAIIKAYLVDSQQQLEAILTSIFLTQSDLNNYVELRQVEGLSKFLNFSRLQREIQAAFEFDDMTLEEFLKAVPLEGDNAQDVFSCLLNQLIDTLAVLQQIGMDIDDIRMGNVLIECNGDRHSFKIFYDEREKLVPKTLSGYK